MMVQWENVSAMGMMVTGWKMVPPGAR